jgi:hypothetical protein
MKYLRAIMQKLIPKELPKPVGRWNIDYCNIKMNKKIDLSNEDHCGPCGQYALEKIELKNKKITGIILEKPKTQTKDYNERL